MATEERNDNGMTPRERLLRALACKDVDRPPVAGMTTTGTTQLMDYAGAAWPEVHTDAAKMTKLALAAYPYLGLESARLPYCLSYEAEALGCKVDLGTKTSTPMVKSNPYINDLDADLILPKPAEIVEIPRNKVILEAAKGMKENAGDIPTIVGVTGPFTIAGHLIGTENLLLGVMTEPEVVHKFVKYAADYVREWLKIVDKLGVDLIQMSEPSASWDMLSAEMFDEYAAPYLRHALGGMENTKKVLHICGNMTEMLDQMISSGADGLSIEEKSDPYKSVKKVDGRASLIGNVGVVHPLLQGTPEDVRKMTLRSVDAGFNIISAGCGLSALIDRENIRAMVETVQNLPPKRK
ncbi:MAG: MtaA/CmuA family methyltransferase [Euryarchaeota archaeon]|nr:MtaA/CmuA family methyltransferase [Euryarchaeota archaeon]